MVADKMFVNHKGHLRDIQLTLALGIRTFQVKTNSSDQGLLKDSPSSHLINSTANCYSITLLD